MKRGLLVIDVQNAYFTGKNTVTYPESSFENILRIMDSANTHGIPIFIIQHTSQNGSFSKGDLTWEIHPKVKDIKHDFLIEKNFPGAFTGTKLDELLKSLNIDTLVITGYMTQMCCDSTARQASHMGYSVEFLSDATGTLDISNYAGEIKAHELHKAILITQAMRFSKVMTTDEWIGII